MKFMDKKKRFGGVKISVYLGVQLGIMTCLLPEESDLL